MPSLRNSLFRFRWLHELAEALEYLHDRKIVHGDIHTANLLLTREEDELHLKLTDFGLSFWPGESRTLAAEDCRAELAPELRNTTHVEKTVELSFAVDVWAFGVVVLALVSGDGDPGDNCFKKVWGSPKDSRFHPSYPAHSHDLPTQSPTAPTPLVSHLLLCIACSSGIVRGC